MWLHHNDIERNQINHKYALGWNKRLEASTALIFWHLGFYASITFKTLTLFLSLFDIACQFVHKCVRLNWNHSPDMMILMNVLTG